jgi:hypothetical protein
MDTSLNMKHNISNNLLLSYTLLTISHITTSGAVDDRKSFKFAVRISESSRLNRRSWSSLFSSEWRLGDHRTLVADRLTDHLYMDNCEPLDIGGLDEYYYCETTLRPASKIMRLLERSNEIEWFEEQMPLKRSKRQHQPTLQASEWNDPYLKDQWYLVC